MGKNRDHSKFPNAITVLDNGNVGINQTSPSVKLDIYTGALANNGYDGLRIADDASHFWFLVKKDGSGNKRFAIYNGQGATPITLQEGGGNVGIGATSFPDTSGFSHLFVGRNFALFSGSGNDIYFGQNFYYNSGFKARYSEPSTLISTSNGDILFQNSSSGTAGAALSVTERMRIASGGDVKIDSSVTWSYSNMRVLQVRGTSFYNYPGYSGWASNIYYNGGWKYYESYGGGYAEFDLNGGFSISTTPSGTGGNSASTTNRFYLNQGGALQIFAQPSFAAYKNDNQEPGSQTILTYENATINRGNCYNTSNSRFTAPVAGVYAFGVKVWFKIGSTGTIWVHLRKNGSNYTEQRMSQPTALPNYSTWFPRWVVPLAAGDYIEVSGYGDNGNFHSSQSEYYSQFYGHLLH